MPDNTDDNLPLSPPTGGLPWIDHHAAGAGSGPLAYYLEAASAANTRRAYQADTAHFLAWGGSMPATDRVVAEYLAAHARILAVSTLRRRLAALASAHHALGGPNPCASELVRLVMRGIMRVHGTAQQRVSPLLVEDIACMSAAMGADLRNLRDRALLQIGFAGAFRRSELVAVNCKNLEWAADGLFITIRRSKSDPYGRGRVVRIEPELGPLRPIESLAEWLTASGVAEGPVFRPISASGRVLDRGLAAGSASTIVKNRMVAMGRDPALFAGHSMRAGFVTSAARSGIPLWSIARQTGHRSIQTVLGYIRD